MKTTFLTLVIAFALFVKTCKNEKEVESSETSESSETETESSSSGTTLKSLSDMKSTFPSTYTVSTPATGESETSVSMQQLFDVI